MSKIPIKCIGKYTKSDKKCLVCVYRVYCKKYQKEEDYGSKHVPVPLDENGNPIEYEEAVDPDVYYDDVEVPFESRTFTYEHIQRITRFFMDMSPIAFVVFRMKLEDRTIPAAEIAKKLHLTAFEVRKSLQLICDLHPELAKLMHKGCPKWQEFSKY